MPKKTTKKNAFYFFMREMKEKEAAKGYNISMNDMATFAHPLWSKLSLPEKEVYEVMAKKYNNDPNLRGGRLASDGTRIEDNMREKEEEEQKLNAMVQGIQRFCNADTFTTEQFKEITSRKVIYFLSFNILCHHQETETYIPIEVGLIEYSIQHGIHREYHKILHPGSIPIGYAGKAKQLSEDKHQISVFGEVGAERDMVAVYNDILQFTTTHRDDEYPPVFCLSSEMEVTIGCLDWLAHKAKRKNEFDVWDASYLLLILRNATGAPLPSVIIAEDLLTKSTFDFHADTRCPFHEEKDSVYCALGYSKRLCFLLSDAVAPYFDVELTEKHLPCMANEVKEYRITVGNDRSRPITGAGAGFNRPLRLDNPTNYYENEDENEENKFVTVQSRAPPKVEKREDRQPVALCLAEEMQRLKLNITPATVPGHGIGRGLRRKN
ncbi:protein maelstrom homolog [Uloborus diversus]|uniref:protein maelstrom homolog n=1 Tax=Uloborus diversus TaxID=327109 RepID=UPI0024094EA2|nr:protein maelstrom homolog [Uloborus diversus]